MNWIVTWIIVNSFSIACPPTVIYDPYLGKIVSPNVDLVACYDTDEQVAYSYFKTYEEALEFVKTGNELYSFAKDYLPFAGNSSYVKDFEVEEVR